MKVLQVCAEIFPLLKTGGLADVAGALPPALKRVGCDVRVLLPAFPAIRRGVGALQSLPGDGQLPYGARLLRGSLPGGTACYLIDAPDLYEREGNPYAGPDGQPYADNHRRFALLGRAAARLAESLDAEWAPQIVHGHDWHAGLAPAYLKAAWRTHGRRVAASVHTVHNLAFQGSFGLPILGELGLPADFYQTHGLEFHGQVSFMKAGLHYADRITTVSPTYAREIQGEEQGCGLDGVLRARAADLSGILNGVDDQVWNPLRDPLIHARYGAGDLASKRTCRAALQQEFGLAAQTQAPLFGVVSRLTEQKGVNLILAGLPELLARGGQLVVLGSGEPALEGGLREAATVHPRSVAVHIGYDEQLAHRIVAGADVLMVPSRFEPCGLTQLYALKYGTLPLVRRVGGLADTVVDCALENLADGLATGFVFERFEQADYGAALRRACALFRRDAEWREVQQRAMGQDFGWNAAAAQYAALYRRLLP
jgi:starch synthase